MKKTPLISVVIPTYNHAHFLGRALQSVIDQTYVNWEVIVIDNHSNDNTEEVLASFEDARIKVLHVHNNGSIAVSRNLGVKESGGDWVAFLDSDDCWYPRKLETIMLAAEDICAYDVLCNDEVMIDKNNGVASLLHYGPFEDDFYQVLLVEGNRLSTSATVIRKDFLKVHDLSFSEKSEHITVEDYGLWLDLARSGARFKFVDEVLGEYLIHETNSSRVLSRNLKNGERLLHDHVYSIQEFNPSPDAVWAKIEVRLMVSRTKQALINRQLGLTLMCTLKLLSRHPCGTAIYITSKFRKKTGSVLKKFLSRKILI